MIGVPGEDISLLIRKINELEGKQTHSTHLAEQVKEILQGYTSSSQVFENLNSLRRFRSEGEKIYKDTITIHQRRIYNMVMFLRFALYYHFGFLSDHSQGIDFKKLRNGALNHDIFEGCTPLGDIPTHIKVQLKGREKEILEELEKQYFGLLSGGLTLSGFHYTGDLGWESLKTEFTQKDTDISILNSYLDKIDGWAMSFFEVIMGNSQFITPLQRYSTILTGENFGKMRNLGTDIHINISLHREDFKKQCANILEGKDKNFALSEKESQFLADFGSSGFTQNEFIERILQSLEILKMQDIQFQDYVTYVGIMSEKNIPDIIMSDDPRIPALFKAWLTAQFPEFKFGESGYEYHPGREMSEGRNTVWGRYTQPLYHLLIPEKPELILSAT